MLEGIKGMAGLAGLMKDLPRIKERMEAVKRELGGLRVEAETGGGAVHAVASGQLRIVSIDVDAALLAGLIEPGDPDDRSMASELIVGAVNAALERAQAAAEQRLAEVAGELGLPLPPGGLKGLIG